MRAVLSCYNFRLRSYILLNTTRRFEVLSQHIWNVRMCLILIHCRYWLISRTSEKCVHKKNKQMFDTQMILSHPGTHWLLSPTETWVMDPGDGDLLSVTGDEDLWPLSTRSCSGVRSQRETHAAVTWCVWTWRNEETDVLQWKTGK